MTQTAQGMSQNQLNTFRFKEYIRQARLTHEAMKALDDIPNYHKADGEATCANCVFFRGGNCTKYKAKVKPSYICDEWKEEVAKKEVSPTPSTTMAHGTGGLLSDPALENSKKKKKQVASAKEASLTPPQSAQNAAKRALEWRDKYGEQVKAMTPVGWLRARQLASGKPVSMDTVKRMAQFNRHRKNADVNPKYKNEPWRDNGHVAWLGWGGTSGIDWAISQVNKANDKQASTKELATTYKHPGHPSQKVHGYRFGKAPSFSKAREYRKSGLLQDYLKRARTAQGRTPVKERNAERSQREKEDFKSGTTKIATTKNGQISYSDQKAKVIGNYAVHDNSVTDTQTGRNITGGFKTQKGAMRVARYIYERYGNIPHEKGEQAVRAWGSEVMRDVNDKFFSSSRHPFDYYGGYGIDSQGRRVTTKETTYKPGGKTPGASIKNPRVYEALRKKGMSKRMAAAISNAQVSGDKVAKKSVVTMTTKADKPVVTQSPQTAVPASTTSQATKDPLHIAIGKSLGQFGVTSTLDAYGAGPEEHGSAWKAPIASLQAIQAALLKAGYKQSGGKFKKNSVLIDTGKDAKNLYLYITDDNGTAKKAKEFVQKLRTRMS
jgi:hypothetical protein